TTAVPFDKKAKKTVRTIHAQTMFISEAGLNSLIIHSKAPFAIQFQDWLAKDVIPSIMNTGQYNINQSTYDKIPKMVYDLVNYKNKSCIYLLLVEDNMYKFGITDGIV